MREVEPQPGQEAKILNVDIQEDVFPEPGSTFSHVCTPDQFKLCKDREGHIIRVGVKTQTTKDYPHMPSRRVRIVSSDSATHTIVFEVL